MKQFSTLCAQSGKLIPNTPAHQTPVFATAAYDFDDLATASEAFTNQPGAHVYSRYGNPTVEAVASSIASLEGFGMDIPTYGLMTGSGMSAIHLVVQAICRPGGKILTQADLYGGTTELFKKVFAQFGIQLVLNDFGDPEALTNILKSEPAISLVYLETPTNPMMNCVDISMVSKVVSEFNIPLVVDNTFSTPYITRPLSLGADLVIHSTTKFLHGHGYSTGGAVIGKDRDLVFGKLWEFLKLNGAILSPFEAMLIQMGVKTLGVRMEKQSQNAAGLANFLVGHPKVRKVYYPGLESHPHHSIAKKQMSWPGAMLSFDIDATYGQIRNMIKSLPIGRIAPSLGEAETMIMHPATMSHLKMPEIEKQKHGITEGLIRLSVGLEDLEDQINAWNKALDAL